jgi:hypothetical protein
VEALLDGFKGRRRHPKKVRSKAQLSLPLVNLTLHVLYKRFKRTKAYI